MPGVERLSVAEAARAAVAAIKSHDSGRVQPGDVVVLICRGPMGSGMEEVYQLTSVVNAVGDKISYEYDDVGKACRWDRLFPRRWLSHSRYEMVLIRAISGQKLRMFGNSYTPVAMRGWSQVVFRRDDRTRHVFPIDFLVGRLDDWKS